MHARGLWQPQTVRENLYEVLTGKLIVQETEMNFEKLTKLSNLWSDVPPTAQGQLSSLHHWFDYRWSKSKVSLL